MTVPLFFARYCLQAGLFFSGVPGTGGAGAEAALSGGRVGGHQPGATLHAVGAVSGVTERWP